MSKWWKGMLLLAALVLATGPAATAADEVMNLLPAQPLVVVRTSGLGPAWAALKDSPWAEKIDLMAPQDIANKLQDLRVGLDQLNAAMGVNVEETLEGLFGGDCVLAVFGEGEAVFIAEGTEVQRLKNAADSVMLLERNRGRIQAQAKQVYELAEITQCTLPDGDRFHCFVGNALVVSKNLDLVKKVVDAAKQAKPLVQTELANAFALMAEDSLIRVYIDTDAVAGKAETLLNGRLANPIVKGFVQHMQSMLALVQFDTLAVALKDGRVELKNISVIDEHKVPAGLKAMYPKFTVKLDTLQLAPESAVWACAHQLDKAALWKYVIDQVMRRNPALAARLQMYTDSFSAMMGIQDFEAKLLPQIGDQVAVFVTSDDIPGSVPAISFAIDLKNDKEIPAGIRALAGTMIGLAQLQARRVDIALANSTYKGVSFTTLTINNPQFVDRLCPTMFVAGGKLVFSSNVFAAKAIVDRHAQGYKDPAKTFKLPRCEGTLAFAGRMQSEELIKMLARHRDVIVAGGVRKGEPQQEVENGLDLLEFAFSLFDGATFYATQSTGRIERVILLDPIVDEQ